jgi:class 3 adenylate cyclase/ABC-type transport system substrate-binding protein
MPDQPPNLPDAVPLDLPTGTVTFLFTDIEGSTKLLQRVGSERYAQIRADHERLLRQAWDEHHGVEVDTQGDAFFVAFPRATDALAAAAQAQRLILAHPWPGGEPVRVRMGLHTGAGIVSHEHYVGLDVNRAARICAAGHGGQVLLSQATRDQVAKELVAGQGIRDLGKHRLKDLPRREEIYQLILPGMPASFPPLKTLDAWPGYRADLVAVVLIGSVLLAAVGLLLPLLVPAFPWVIGIGAAVLVALALVITLLARPVRRSLLSQWRDARKPFAATTSALLSVIVVVTTLFITKPTIFIGPKPLGYDFSYTYHAPTHRGGTVTVEFGGTLQGLTPYASMGTSEIFTGLWQSCLILLPDVALGLPAYKPDQCTEVPTVANRGEDPDGKWTIFHIDPRAVWSDREPITADDYLFADQLLQDPNIGGGLPGVNAQHRLTALDPRTVRIDWSAPSGFGDYLGALVRIQPVPLHVYAIGKFAGVYDPKTGAYNSALAQQLVASPSYLTHIPVDDGPFTLQNFVPNSRAVLVRNPRFFSNFFHAPAALDRVTLVTVNPQFQTPQGLSASQAADIISANYRHGGVELGDWLDALDLGRLGGIPKAEVVTSPLPNWLEIGFNQRAEAPNAQANGGVSIFADKNVRKAFVEAFDRCAAVRAQLGAVNCSDPNLFTNEPTTSPALDYDPSITLPGYNPADAARLMDQAGYPVVDGIRRDKDGKTPLHVTIDTSVGGAQASVVARRMQQDYSRSLKIAVTLVLKGDLFVSGAATQGTFDIGLYTETGAPDTTFNVADTILCCTVAKGIPSAQHPDGGDILGIVDPLVDQQTQLGARTPDSAQSANVYREMQRYWAQQFYAEPVFIEANVELVKPTLCNFKAFPQFTGNLWNMADWYVAPSCP